MAAAMLPLVAILMVAAVPGGDTAKGRCKVKEPPKAAAGVQSKAAAVPGERQVQKSDRSRKLEPLRPDCPTAAQRWVPGLH